MLHSAKAAEAFPYPRKLEAGNGHRGLRQTRNAWINCKPGVANVTRFAQNG
jgi:hypothetical protein